MKTTRLFIFLSGLNFLLVAASAFFFFARPTGSAVPASKPLLESHKIPHGNADHALFSPAGLRSAGIPEDQIRQVITTQVAAQFEDKRQQILSKPATTGASRLQKEQLLSQLAHEQEAEISRQIGAQPRQSVSAPPSAAKAVQTSSAASGTQLATTAVQPTSSADQSGPSDRLATGYGRVILPAALVPDNPAIPVTTSKQVAQWEKGQDAFINATGGSFPNPNNQKDQASWIAAQRASDAMFKAQMGTPAFIVQNLGAGRYKQP